MHPTNPPTTAHPEYPDRPSFGAIAVNVGSTKRAHRTTFVERADDASVVN